MVSNIKLFFLIIGTIIMTSINVILGIYAFRHPEKTQTQLSIDIFTGKMFKEF